MSKKSVSVEWNAVKGATGYVVYSYNSANGKWVLLGTTTKNYYYNFRVFACFIRVRAKRKY